MQSANNGQQPSFYGVVRNDEDSSMIFRMANNGECKIYTARLRNKIRKVYPGQGFVFDAASKIKRWTDGYSWADSYHRGGRIMIYKQAMVVVRADGTTKRQAIPGGLKKKTVADTESTLRIVCYYHEGDNKDPQATPITFTPVLAKPIPTTPLCPSSSSQTPAIATTSTSTDATSISISIRSLSTTTSPLVQSLVATESKYESTPSVTPISSPIPTPNFQIGSRKRCIDDRIGSDMDSMEPVEERIEKEFTPNPCLDGRRNTNGNCFGRVYNGSCSSRSEKDLVNVNALCLNREELIKDRKSYIGNINHLPVSLNLYEDYQPHSIFTCLPEQHEWGTCHTNFATPAPSKETKIDYFTMNNNTNLPYPSYPVMHKPVKKCTIRDIKSTNSRKSLTSTSTQPLIPADGATTKLYTSLGQSTKISTAVQIINGPFMSGSATSETAISSSKNSNIKTDLPPTPPPTDSDRENMLGGDVCKSLMQTKSEQRGVERPKLTLWTKTEDGNLKFDGLMSLVLAAEIHQRGE